MRTIVWILYVALTIIMAITTVVEYSQGTAFVSENIYHSPAFVIGWGLLVLFTLGVVWKQRMWKHLPVFLLHLSFVVILAGAFLSFLSSRKGYIHLRLHTPVVQFMEQETRLLQPLPFEITLDTFFIQYYPGTDAPSDYVSRVTCSAMEKVKNKHAVISMNKVLDFQGYRFCQSSFDEDHKGSWLSVNYDPWGTAVTYLGYFMLGVSMLAVLFRRQGAFHKLLNHPLLKSCGVFLLFCLMSTESFAAQKKLSIISRDEADSLATVQIIYHDRVVPFNTLARDFVKKLTGQETFNDLTAEEVVGSWMKYPEEWKFVPIIRVKNKELLQRLGVESSSYIRLVDVFDGSQYRLREWWQPNEQIIGKPSALQKAILETDEKVALIGMLCQATLFRYLPADGSVAPLSDMKVQAEFLYNSIPFSKLLFMFCLSMGFLSFGWLLWRMLRSREIPLTSGKWMLVWQMSLLVALLFHAVGYALRWYISGRIPLSNGYETMQFLSLCVLALAFLLRCRFIFVIPFGFLLSGFTLLVSYLGQMNPQITPLMPVLVSPWLSAHVSCIMISYALLAFTWFNSFLGLFIGREAERLMLFSRLLLYPAVCLLGAGIFIGAVWANVSWGRYWAWDPKEVWALITFMVYAFPFHANSIPCFLRPRFFHFYMLFAFLTVLMTYFGVNYLLGGMHSYA